MAISKANIGQALHSVADDHVTAVANDIYDETLGKYQSEINAEVGQGDGVYDISEAYPTEGSPTQFASLQDALTAFTDTTKKKGGMTIKFIQGTGNDAKYVQYRNISSVFSAALSNWQKIGGDDNGYGNAIMTKDDVFLKDTYEVPYYPANFGINNTNGKFDTTSSHKHVYLPVKADEVYHVKGIPDYATIIAFATTKTATSGGNVPFASGITSTFDSGLNASIWVTIPTGCTVMLICSTNYASTGFDVRKKIEITDSVNSGDKNIITGGAVYNSIGEIKESLSAEITPALRDYTIQTTDKFSSNADNKHGIINVSEGESYTIEAIYNGYPTRYAFVTSDAVSQNGDVPLVSGTHVIELAYPNKVTLTVPNTAKYLLVHSPSTTAKINKEDGIFEEIEKKFETNEKYNKAVVELASKVSLITRDYSVSANGTFGTSTNNKHGIVEVTAKELIIIESTISTTGVRYAFATADTFGAGAEIPLVEDTVVVPLAAYERKMVEVPNGASYLLVNYPQGANVLNFKNDGGGSGSIRNRTIFPLMTYDFIKGSNGNFAEDYSNWVSESHISYATPRFIKTSLDFTIKVTNVIATIYVFCYAEDFSFIERLSFENTAANTIKDVAVAAGTCYVKFCVVSSSGKPNVVISGMFGDDWDTFNPRPTDNGYQRIQVLVNITNPNSCDGEISEGESEVVQDQQELLPDYGLICLPPSYKHYGEPTRLIIYCHGAAVNYANNVTRFNQQDLEPNYWLAEGYAVMDIEGNPFNNVDKHIHIPQAMDCYVAAYKWAIEHYNLKRDGVFVGGRSMGGANTLNLIRRECPIPVIAACPNAIAPETFGYNIPARRKFIAEKMGFTYPGDDGFELDGKETTENLSGYDNSTVGVYTWGDFMNFNKDSWGDSTTERDATPVEIEIIKYNWEKYVKCVPQYNMLIDLPDKDTVMSPWYYPNNATINNIYRNGKTPLEARVGMFDKCHAIAKCPIKFFSCYEDSAYNVGAKIFYKSFINSGQIVENRVFHSFKNYSGTGTTAHHYDTQDPAIRTTITTRFGELLTNIPIVYIEMLQFWRRYEQGN